MPPVPQTFTDAVEAVRAWINGLTWLVGAGNPLPSGAHRWEERSPAEGAYALLTYAGGGPDSGDAVFIERAQVSASVYAGTDAAARVAALAYADALEQFQYQPPVVVTLATTGAQVLVLAVDNITGPTSLAAAGGGFLVNAMFSLQPVP